MPADIFIIYWTSLCKSYDRQFHLHILLHQQIRQSKVLFPMLGSTEIVVLVYPTRHEHFSHIPSGTLEHHGGLIEQEILPRPRVGARYKTLHHVFSWWGIPNHRSLCQMPSVLLVSGPRPWVPGRCVPHYMRCPTTLHLSTLFPCSEYFTRYRGTEPESSL